MTTATLKTSPADMDIASWQLCRPSYHQKTGDFLFFTPVPRPVFTGTATQALQFYKELGTKAPVLQKFSMF